MFFLQRYKVSRALLPTYGPKRMNVSSTNIADNANKE